MKDIITGTSLTDTKRAATEKWHEYKAASKAYKDPIYSDLQKVYNQVKGGRKVVDIFKVIQKGGVHENFHPKLAIAKATTKKVFCHYEKNGDVKFLNSDNWKGPFKEDVVLPCCLPAIPEQMLPIVTWNKSIRQSKLVLEAPVPICPPKLLPKILTADYYILWEVDVWKMVPPTDPYLLRRITNTMFVVVAGWDLTEIEKAAMAGRMH